MTQFEKKIDVNENPVKNRNTILFFINVRTKLKLKPWDKLSLKKTSVLWKCQLHQSDLNP